MPVHFKKTKKTLMVHVAFTLIVVLSASAFAADAAVKGYLVDVACIARKSRRPESLTTHSKSCMKMPSCNSSGFGILTEEKQFIKFDEDGNEKARKFLSETNVDHDFKVIVSGNMDGDKLKVIKIESQ
jgi:hypothetical protein